MANKKLQSALIFVKLAIGITVAITSLIIYPILAQTRPSVLVARKLPPVVTTPPPPPNGDRIPRTDLGGSSSACKATDKKLTALVPIESERGATRSQSPTLWFYIPDAAQDIASVELKINSRDEKNRLYQASIIQLPATPGVIGIRLPESLQSKLKEGEYYRWYFRLNCAANSNSEDNPVVNGWVRRVPANDTATTDIWYDMLTDLANRRLAAPQNEKLKQEWRDLLKSVGLEQLASEGLGGSVSLP